MNLTGLRLIRRPVVVTAIVVVMAGALSAVPAGSPEAQFIFGPEREESWLSSAEVTSDGKVGLFSFKQIFQRRAQPEAYVSAGKYRVGTRAIAGYDLTSRRITVIHRSPGTEESKFQWGWQTWGYRISGICWDKVLVEGDERALYWLDMPSGTLTRTALREEWTAKGIDVRHYWVIDRHGTIAMWALPARREGALAMAQYLWVRTPSGKYIDVGPFHDARMLDDNRFLLKSPLVALHASGSHNVLYSMTTGARQLTPQEGADLVMQSLYPSHRSYWCSRADRHVQFILRQGGVTGPLERNPAQIELWRRSVREFITLDVEALGTALRR